MSKEVQTRLMMANEVPNGGVILCEDWGFCMRIDSRDIVMPNASHLSWFLILEADLRHNGSQNRQGRTIAFSDCEKVRLTTLNLTDLLSLIKVQS